MKEGGRKGRDERKRGEIKEGVGRWIKKREGEGEGGIMIIQTHPRSYMSVVAQFFQLQLMSQPYLLYSVSGIW